MNGLTPVQTTNHATRRRDHVPSLLASATHVFVRRDARAPPLTRPYTGPFRVISAQEKYFELDLNGKTDRVSIDRLKPAFLENQDSAIVCYGPRTNQSKPFQSRDQDKIPSEEKESYPTQPLAKKRGRPSREELAERRRMADARDRERGEQRQREPVSPYAFWPY